MASRFCHSCESRNPDVVPAKAGNRYFKDWIPGQARNDKQNKSASPHDRKLPLGVMDFLFKTRV